MAFEEEPDQETKDRWHKDPENWWLGIFYFNVRDKRVLVPKKMFILGWTFNFANPLSYALMAAFLLLLWLIGSPSKKES